MDMSSLFSDVAKYTGYIAIASVVSYALSFFIFYQLFPVVAISNLFFELWFLLSAMGAIGIIFTSLIFVADKIASFFENKYSEEAFA